MYPPLYADMSIMKSNLKLRGSTYWWRRKVTVAGQPIAIALSLKTGNYKLAYRVGSYLVSILEALRMSYGERGTVIDRATLQRVFSDAMRWQLERILADQVGGTPQAFHHIEVNKVYAELWGLFARGGPDAKWTADEDERLGRQGWSIESRNVMAEKWEDARHGEAKISVHQIDAYAERFGFEKTTANIERICNVIYSARAKACIEATRHLLNEGNDFAGWSQDALADETPFAFEHRDVETAANTVEKPAQAAEAGLVTPVASPAPQPSSSMPLVTPDQPVKGKKLLKDAAKDCIAFYSIDNAWSADTRKQVGTAIKLFDYACGGDIAVEDITQAHVTRFKTLCDELPNRWGRTTDEQAGGIAASEMRAKNMDKSLLGMSQGTISKHITWITQVLNFVAGENGEGHEPATSVSFKKARKPIGKKSGRVRTRDLRKAWTKEEVATMFSAPIWTGCAGLDDRFIAGDQVWQDGAYWLGIMCLLYGNRSSEVAALPLIDVHEDAEIGYFMIDFTDLRDLKNMQSVRSLPIHPELIRLGFLDYVKAMRALGHTLLFPELHSASSTSFASTFYKSVFGKWRAWAFPNGTSWRHQVRGAVKDKDVHSFRGTATSFLKGKVPDSVRIDILGHEGDEEISVSYDEEASLALKLDALKLMTPLTSGIQKYPLRLRPVERQKFGGRRGRAKGVIRGLGVQ